MALSKNAADSYNFIRAQTNAIETSKFIESQKRNRDLYYDEWGKPSQSFYLWWIKNHAEKFRGAWPISSCKSCSKVTKCKNVLKEQCSDFDKNTDQEITFYDVIK